MDNLIERIEALVPELGNLPLNEGWMYSGIRHVQRNCYEIECDDGPGGEPDRQAGTAIAKLLNMMPEIIAALKAPA